MVAEIERVMGPHGSVRRRVRLRDTRGRLREIDVLIAFRHANREYHIAFECRRREHKDGIEWLDQLENKYKYVPQVNRVVAVSASGFSEGALAAARNAGIDAMTLSETDTGNWRIQWGVDHMAFYVCHGGVVEVGVHYPPGTEGPELGNAELRHDSALFVTKENDGLSVRDLWSRYISGALFADPAHAPRVPTRRQVVLRITEDYPLCLTWESHRYPVSHLAVLVEYWVEPTEVALLPAHEYRDVETGEVKWGIREAAEPVVVDGKPVYLRWHYEPLDECPDGVAKMYITMRPSEDGFADAEGQVT